MNLMFQRRKPADGDKPSAGAREERVS